MCGGLGGPSILGGGNILLGGCIILGFDILEAIGGRPVSEKDDRRVNDGDVESSPITRRPLNFHLRKNANTKYGMNICNRKLATL